MTGDDDQSPQLPLATEVPQVNLRAALVDQIDDAQTEIDRQLSELRQPANGRADPSIAAQLSSRLTALNALRQAVGIAPAAALAQLQMAVSVQVAASNAATALAEATGDAPGDFMNAYQIATAALDQKVAALMAVDQAHNDEAHDAARKYGTDLSDLDAERAQLLAERDDAIARGDKVAERRADWLLGQNTVNEMTAVGADITDPAERAQFAKNTDAAKKNADALHDAYNQQQSLQAGLRQEPAAEQSVPNASNNPAPPTVQVAQSANASFDSFAATLSLPPLSGQIALATDPQAHQSVEAPSVPRSTGGRALV